MNLLSKEKGYLYIKKKTKKINHMGVMKNWNGHLLLDYAQ